MLLYWGEPMLPCSHFIIYCRAPRAPGNFLSLCKDTGPGLVPLAERGARRARVRPRLRGPPDGPRRRARAHRGGGRSSGHHKPRRLDRVQVCGQGRRRPRRAARPCMDGRRSTPRRRAGGLLRAHVLSAEGRHPRRRPGACPRPHARGNDADGDAARQPRLSFGRRPRTRAFRAGA